MNHRSLLAAGTTALVLVLAPLATTSAAVADQAVRPGHAQLVAHTQSKHTSEKSSKPGKPHKPKFHVAKGPTFTNANDSSSTAIRNKILRTIAHTPRGAKIRLVSWNFDSFRYVGALTAAHKRGVSVRLIMSRQLAEAQGPRGPFASLTRNLAGYGNAERAPKDRSFTKTCDHSCRGKGGSMHAKYYIFSQSGSSPMVVMNTSANLTGASASVQWNEMYTVVDDKTTYQAYMHVFNQAVKDVPQKSFLYHDGDITGWFYPRLGRSDLVMDVLDPVRCNGAQKKSGIDGHTEIRVGQDVFNNKRGLTIARKLLALHRHGCNVRVVYSQAVGDQIRSVINQLPNNHLVQDRDGDGAYDRYLHAKLLTVSGHWGKDRSKHIVMDGSANYSATAVQSDEQGMIIYDQAALERKYAKFIDHMFKIHLVSAAPVYTDPGTEGRAVVPHHVNPYRNMEG